MFTGKAEVELTSDQLFIDGVLQSDRRDEYIYHEALVHPALAHTADVQKVLILGGAEGCTLREVLKWPQVKSVTQVDWDGVLCEMFKNRPSWNAGSYHDQRLKLIIGDAWDFCRIRSAGSYDVILVDLLDPAEEDVERFLELLVECRRLLRQGGTLVANCGGVWPWNTRVLDKILAANPDAKPYKVFVPSFEWEWSFILIGGIGEGYGEFPKDLCEKTRMFDMERSWRSMRTWTRDWSAGAPQKMSSPSEEFSL